MLPYFDIFGRQLPSYAMLALIGGLIAGVFLCVRVWKQGYDENDTIFFLFMCVIGVAVGGHLLYIITKAYMIPYVFSATGIIDFINRYAANLGGQVFYGGLIGGAVAAFITTRVKKLDHALYGDGMAVAIPLFHGFARVGCFLGGCCYGIESEFGFTAHGNPWVPELNGVSRFPVQLLEAGLNFILAAVLYILMKRGDRTGLLRGKLLGVYFASYAVIRFGDEFLRGDAVRGFILGLSTSQFISIFMFLAGLAYIIWNEPIRGFVFGKYKAKTVAEMKAEAEAKAAEPADGEADA